jgi:hypothetical protein
MWRPNNGDAEGPSNIAGPVRGEVIYNDYFV